MQRCDYTCKSVEKYRWLCLSSQVAFKNHVKKKLLKMNDKCNNDDYIKPKVPSFITNTDYTWY